MRALVLVGGEGTRLRPLTLTIPKQMLPVGRRPMIERVVDHLGAHGVTEVTLSLGYRPDAFRAVYPDGRCGAVPLRYAVESRPLDTAGAIAFAADQAGFDDTFIVVNGDVLTTTDISALVRLHQEREAAATIALTPVEDPSRFGVVRTEASGRVLEFVEKPPRGESPSNHINAGIYVMEPTVLEQIPRDRRVSVEKEVFPKLVAQGTLYARTFESYWADAGTPITYLEANLRYSTEECPDAIVSPDATVVGSVLGPDVVVEGGAQVVHSVVLAGAMVGPGAVVRQSIIGPRARVEEGSVLDTYSVIGEAAVVPAGTKRSGARLPEPVS